MSIWKDEKRFIDLWSLVHFLSGFLLGGLFWWLGTEFLKALWLTFALLVLWEVFEWATSIIEKNLNVIADVIIGMLGFFLATYLYYERNLFDPSVYITLLGATAILSIWGFTDYLKRDSKKKVL